MGEAPARLTLERKNNDLGYSLGNCVWASVRDQMNNQRRNVIVEYEGRSLTLGQWATELGLNYDTLWRRYQRIKDVSRLLTPGSIKTSGWKHGTRTGYEYGCRCAECKAFNTARARKYRSRVDGNP